MPYLFFYESILLKYDKLRNEIFHVGNKKTMDKIYENFIEIKCSKHENRKKGKEHFMRISILNFNFLLEA